MTHAPLSIRSATRADIPAIVECARSTSEEEEVGFGTLLSLRTFNDVERLSAVWRDPNVAYSDAWDEEERGRRCMEVAVLVGKTRLYRHWRGRERLHPRDWGWREGNSHAQAS